MEGIYATEGYPFFFLLFFEDVPSVELMYPVFTSMSGGVTEAIQVSVVVSLVC